jgi:uncharacterized protein (TIGR01777 family)
MGQQSSIIGITGGTGFIGSHLARRLVEQGHEVVIFTTHPAKKKKKTGYTYSYWNPEEGKCDLTSLKKLDALVNLAGAGIADKTWTPKRKREIVDSRVKATHFLTSRLREYGGNCKVFISASAIGYYGPDRGLNGPFEETAPHYHDFLGETCERWEHEALSISDKMRTVIFRFGIVLGRESGMFRKVAQPMSLGAVPILGSGHQVISWIHVEDLVGMLYKAITDDSISGIFNAAAPHPVSHKTLMELIAHVKGGIKLPVHIPTALLRYLLGEMSKEVLKSCTVSADKALNAGFTFQYDTAERAVKDILSPHYR